MKLKKLELNGFKSFADRTEIVFNDGITGIVGPNGSGKSNIGDAVRWALGEQSPKTLRGAKMEDVIFGGTQKRKRSSYCEVSLLFDNEDGKLKSAFSEVCVTRRVYRDGDSEYMLNHVACRLKDIQELFRDTGIGREGYSLIGQGRIDEILSQKSEDRRQIFEEAAGIMTYRVRKEEAERKLNRTTENLSRVYDIIDEIEKHLSRLGAEAEIAKEYRTLFERMRFLEANLFLVRSDRLNERIQQLTVSLESLRDAQLTDEARLSTLNEQRETIDQELTAAEQSVSAARLTYSAQLQETHDAELRAERIQHELEQATNDRDQAISRQEAFKAELHQLSNQLTRDQEAHQRLTRQVSQTHAALDVLVQASSQAQQQADSAEDALNQHKSAILASVRQQANIREAQSRQSAIREQMARRVEELDASIASLQSQYALLTAQTDQDNSEYDAAVRELSAIQEKYDTILGRLKSLAQTAGTLNSEAQKKNVALQADRSRLRLMEEMSRDMTGYQQSVKKALDYAQRMPGVHGVLARLIDVPAELETAIDMALGGALQNIVTDNENTAKQIIDYLRVNRLGRATFLPVSTIRSRVLSAEERRLLTMPGCLGAASELISFKNEFRGIVENLLGRTVIADTLDHGIPIMRAGRHAFRLVTLNGDVMHSGGSMTGGTTQSRTVSLLGREREIKELRESIELQSARLRQMNEELSLLGEQNNQASQEQADTLKALQEAQIAAARLKERLQADRQDTEQVHGRLQETEAARAQLSASIEEIDADLRQSAINAEQSENRQEMEQQTDRLQEEMLTKRSEAERARNAVTDGQLKLNSLTHDTDSLSRNIRTAQARAEDHTRRLNELQTRLQTLSASIQTLSDSAREASDSVTRLKQQHTASLTVVEDLDRHRADRLNAQRELMRALEDAHRQSETDNQRVHKAELSLSKAQNDLSQMTDHLLNAYDLSYADAVQYRSETPLEMGKADQEVAALRTRIREMGSANTASIEAYEAELARYNELTAQRDDLLKAKSDLESLIKRLLHQMEGIFTAEFAKLAAYFKETFVRLFGGGHAELTLAEADDPLNCGIEITAQPPGKKLQLLSLLSGGERALTAIAILFAMLKLKPTPFCILDEIEAALDDSNISNFADYLSEYAKTTQFVVVTHRKGTMESCDTLYGVAMEEQGISRMVSVNLADYPN